MHSHALFRPGAARGAILAAATLLVCACGNSGRSGDGPAADTGAVQAVETAVVGTRDIDVTLDAVGTAYASGQVDIRPQIGGTLIAAPFVEGDEVEVGHALAVFDDSKARASLALVQAQLDSARAKVAVATERLGRFGRLVREDLVSREEYATLESEQKAAAATVREKEAEVRLAERNLEDYTLKAPISGRMGIRHVDVGNFVEAGTVIATLVAADPLEVLFTVPGSALPGIAVGQEAQIRDTDPARTAIGRGRIRVLDPRVDTATRMASVKALVPNPDHRLKAGQFVGVTLVREHRAAAPVVPEDAVVANAGRTWVFVVDGDRARRREVVVGERLPGLVEVRAGVEAGDTIVVRGQHRLTDGSRIEKSTPASAPGPGAGSR